MYELIGLLVEGQNEPLAHTQILRDYRLKLPDFVLSHFDFRHLCLASLKKGFEFGYLANWSQKELLGYGVNAGYIKEDERNSGSAATAESVARQILENRRYEVIGWLRPVNLEEITRPHSATIEAVTDREAIEKARAYAIPHYSWSLRRVNKLWISGRAVIYEDGRVPQLKEDGVFGDYYMAHGVLSDADGHEHMGDEPHSFVLRAITLEDAVRKAQNHFVQYYNWHFGKVEKLEGKEKEELLANLRSQGLVD